MVSYSSMEYFEALAEKLNADPTFRERAGDLEAELLFVTNDRPDGCLLRVDHGKVSVENVPAGTPAEFVFFAPYDTWVSNHRDGIPLEKLIMTGKVRLKGSIPRILTIKSQLTMIDQTAKTIPASY